jgi:outer membrane lipoprotein SlyB
VQQVAHEGKGSGAGAIIGGVAGGALASNIGKGGTRTLATIAGALGGGLLGNSVEKSQTKTVSYQVTVRMDDGSARSIDSATMPSWRIGDKVRLASGGNIVSR